MHKLIRAIVVLFVVIVVSVLETESSQRLVDHYERKLNNLQKKINKGKPIVVNGKIKRYKCIEEYVSVDEYGNVIESEADGKSDTSYVKSKNLSTTTSTPLKKTIEKDTKKLTIQHLPNTDSDQTNLSRKVISSIPKSYPEEAVERLPSTTSDDDEQERTSQLRRKERRFGMGRSASGSDEEEHYDDYEDDYYVEERPVVRRGRNRGLVYRRRPTAYYIPYERRIPASRSYSGNFVNDRENYVDNEVEPVTQMPMYRRNPLRQQAVAPPLPSAANVAVQQITTPQPVQQGARFAPMQRATPPGLAQPGFLSYIANRHSMVTTPKSTSFVQGNGIEEEDATTQKPAASAMYKARGNYGTWDLQKPTPETCRKIIHMAQLYNVPDVQSWIRHNCIVIQSIMIQAPCDVIFNFVDQCYKRKML
uniref:Ground-like domain-containing protein n=1 Tax=Steinernema glaseri TaxID=37863 RepID=A0A1I7ZUX5_9BILA